MKENYSKLFLLLTVIFVATLIVSNIISVKLIDILGFVLPAGVIVFPVTYILGDILTEVYGFKKVKQVIILGFLANLLVVIFIYLAIKLPAAEFWTNQTSFDAILGQTGRLLLASFLGYLVGSITNAWFMEFIGKLTKSKYLWIRTIGSTIIGQGLDTVIFLVISFWGLIEQKQLFDMITNQWIAKVAYEALVTPITYLFVSIVRKAEG